MTKKAVRNIINGWVEADNDEFWFHNKDRVWTGLTIARLTDEWAYPFKPETFHIRFYPQDDLNEDYDIGDASTLEEAKSLAELHYSRERESKDLWCRF